MPGVGNHCCRAVWIAAALCLAVSAAGAEFHVAPDGKPYHEGSRERPWDLATALAGGVGSPVRPGDTVWLHGGTYRGGFVSRLEGTAAAPVTLRQAPGEWATIDCRPRSSRDDGLFRVLGPHGVYWGFEVTCSDPRRQTLQKGPWPDDLHRGGIDCRAGHVKFINLTVHDVGTGFGFWSEAVESEIAGCLIFHNGWKGPDRGHGHAIYAQNSDGTKRLIDNIIFGQFGYGIHCYGSAKADLAGFEIRGNVGFLNGCLTAPDHRSAAVFVGGEARVDRVTIADNILWNDALRCGYPWGTANGSLSLCDNVLIHSLLYVRDFERVMATGNHVFGEDVLVRLEQTHGQGTSRYRWDRNDYGALDERPARFSFFDGTDTRNVDLAGWQAATGLDADSTSYDEPPREPTVVVRPNPYERGRGHVIVGNWNHAETVTVDLGPIVDRGRAFRIVSARNIFGPAVVEGTYRGKPVELPMRPVPPAPPVGMDDITLPATEPAFGAFVVLSD